MKKSLLTLIAIVMSIGMSWAGDKTIYLNPAGFDSEGNWASNNAVFSAYVLNGGGNEWIPFTGTVIIDGKECYKAVIPDSWTGMNLVRQNPNENRSSWDSKWNQTDEIDLSTIADNTLFTITSWDEYSTSTPISISGTCGATSNDNVAWAVTDTDGNSSYETLTISGTGAMADYTSNGWETCQPWRSFDSDIKSVVVEDGVTHIGNSAFEWLNKVQHITIGKDVETIGDYVCKNCSLRVSVIIPPSVTEIGAGAFANNDMLYNVYVLPTTVPTLGADAFGGFHLVDFNIYVPSAQKGDYEAADGWKTYAVNPAYTVIADQIANMTLTGNVGVQYGSTVFAAIGETVSLTMTDPSVAPTGYTTSGYYSATAGNLSRVGDSYTSYTLTIANADVFISCFSPITYDIIYHLNDGSMDVEFPRDSYNIESGDVTLPTATKAGIPLYGWYTDSELTQGPVYKIPAGSTGPKEFWAKYAKNIANCTATVPDQLLETTEYNASHIGDRFGAVPQYIGESVKDGNTVLTLGTDYEFGGVYFYGTENLSTTTENKTGDHFTVVIRGIGNYAGTLEADFYIGVTVAPTEWNNVTWEISNGGVLSISLTDPTGENKTMPTEAAYNSYPWHAYHSNITSVVIGDGITNVANHAFRGTQSDNYSGVTTVTLPASVTSIGEYAFEGCTNLATLSGASGVTNVGENAFYDTAWLTNLPDGLTYVGHVAYRFKGTGTSVTLDAATTQIADFCFYNSQITSITIPDGVTSIGDHAFANSALTSVIIPASVTSIGGYAFAHSALQKIYVLRSGSNIAKITQLGSYAFEGCNLSAIIVPAATYNYYNNPDWNSDNNLTPGYTVTCEDGITATTGGPLVAEDEVVTLSHNDRADYAFNGYSVKDSENYDVAVYEEDGVYTFWMPDANVTVSAIWKPANNITVTANKVGSNYWTTFYCGDAGYRIPDDEEAYAYTATVDNSTVTLHLLGKVIPMGSPAIIIGEDNSISMNRDDVSIAEFSADNDLHGVNVRTLKSTLGTGTFYILSKQNDKFGFHKYTADYMPARKAYLLIADSSAPSLTMVFDNETTEIKTTDFTDYTDKADTWYSLDGRKLDKQPTAKGIYIHNGRKEVVR